MNLEQAWALALEQLQIEMPRAAFDTWVRDAYCISLKDNILTIGTRNSYAADWLTRNLSGKTSELVGEMLGLVVETKFVVQNVFPHPPQEEAEPEASKEEPAFNNPSLIRARVSLSEYEAVVQPGRKVVFPAYFLRHIHRLGPELAWMVIAMRQLVFLNHAAKPIPGREIARWAGMSRRAFWRWAKRMDSMKEFVDRRVEMVEGQKLITYTVWADDSCPLTPSDAKNLIQTLTDLLSKYGSPEAVVQILMEIPAAEIRTRILPIEANFADEPGECVTVNELVQWLGWPAELGERLQKRIMDAFGLTILTWHFMLKLLPALDHGPAWMITILRDMCYDGRDQRNSTALAPMMLAKMCGLSGKWVGNTLSDWLRKELVQSMVLDADLGDKTIGANRAHRYQVSFFDPILSDEEKPQTPHKPSAPQDEKGIEGEWQMDRGQVADGSREGGRQVEAKWQMGRGEAAHGSRSSGTSLNLFNPLNQALLNPLTSTNPKPAGTLHIHLDKTTSRSVGERQNWVLSEILRECEVNPKKREELLLKSSATDFLATLIYAHSPWGGSIQNPVSFAVSHVLDPQRHQKLEDKRKKQDFVEQIRTQAHVRPEKHARDPDDDVFRMLACLPPHELAHLLEQQYAAGQPESKTGPPELPIWIHSGLNRLSPEAVQALAARLGAISF